MELKIIAELAKNHNGSMPAAYALIDDAILSGANEVKFQAYGINDLNPKHPNYERYKNSYFSLEQIRELKAYCDVKHVRCYCSCFTIELLPYLSKITNVVKIPSHFLDVPEFVKLAIELFPEVHASNGMMDLSESYRYFDQYMEYAYKLKKTFVPYHCVSMYPTANEHARLDHITYLKRKYGTVGYSDHSVGNEAALLAVILGATYIEKHFAMNNSMQPWCWTDIELKRYIYDLKKTIAMCKSGSITQAEIHNKRYYIDEYQGRRKCQFKTLPST